MAEPSESIGPFVLARGILEEPDEKIMDERRARAEIEAPESLKPGEGPKGNTWRPHVVAMLTDRAELLASALSFDAEDGTHYLYIEKDPGCASIIDCKTDVKTLYIPESINGLTVTELGDFSFASVKSIEEAYCPETATTFGKRVFEHCSKLRKLVFPSTLETFERTWIQGCKSLLDLTLPGGITEYHADSSDFTRLESLTIGAHVHDITLGGFVHSTLKEIRIHPDNEWFATDGRGIYTKGFERLIVMAVRCEDYAIADGCKVVGEKAFAYDTLLRFIHLPETVETIEPFAFSTSTLERFEAPSSLRHICAKAFFQCSHLMEVKLAEGLTDLDEQAFASCGITQLVLPASLHSLGRDVAMGSNISFDGDVPMLSISSDNPRLFIDSRGGLYKRAPRGLVLTEMLNSRATNYTVLPGTIEVAKNAFVGHNFIESITFPEGLESVGADAFRQCSKLEHVDMPESIRHIGREAFLGTSLASFYIPASLDAIEPFALATAYSAHGQKAPTLKKMTIHPDNKRFFLYSGVLCRWDSADRVQAVQYIGPDANVKFLPQTQVIEGYAFNGVTGVRSISFGLGIQGVGDYGLGFRVLPDVIRVQCKEPAGAWVEPYFAANPKGRNSFVNVVWRYGVDAEHLCNAADDVLVTEEDNLLRFRHMVERLASGIYLEERHSDYFKEYLSYRLPKVVAEFARVNFTDGFDALADAGILNEQNITELIDGLAGSDNTQAVGHLLELKRRRFGSGDRWANFDEEFEL